jgi:hypothetical protein
MSNFCDTCLNSGKIACQECRVTLPDFPTNYREKLEVKPPLGIIPRHIWEAQRVQDIIEATDRYTDANKAMPLEWIDEYNDLVKQPIRNDALRVVKNK